ncbi:uncharacterized protein LOC113468954 isoform X1 [Diaphorina citri]|uniref:Uncharacterized protein LOC113468954 isoform X1 n=2 Tax=Diaphorina citri TaxID=121845 RepID=A0A3Q0J0X1_DIACI|nr:uncharacterized protein LOC113468954 isoform X1 [Diaphorina citri]XP_026682096.1 uncharacterized protein LOC113468954 isoform X1 [Diaphorina citri]
MTGRKTARRKCSTPFTIRQATPMRHSTERSSSSTPSRPRYNRFHKRIGSQKMLKFYPVTYFDGACTIAAEDFYTVKRTNLPVALVSEHSIGGHLSPENLRNRPLPIFFRRGHGDINLRINRNTRMVEIQNNGYDPGLFVNGVRVAAGDRRYLRYGDVIGLGQGYLRPDLEDEEEEIKVEDLHDLDQDFEPSDDDEEGIGDNALYVTQDDDLENIEDIPRVSTSPVVSPLSQTSNVDSPLNDFDKQNFYGNFKCFTPGTSPVSNSDQEVLHDLEVSPTSPSRSEDFSSAVTSPLSGQTTRVLSSVGYNADADSSLGDNNSMVSSPCQVQTAASTMSRNKRKVDWSRTTSFIPRTPTSVIREHSPLLFKFTFEPAHCRRFLPMRGRKPKNPLQSEFMTLSDTSMKSSDFIDENTEDQKTVAADRRPSNVVQVFMLSTIAILLIFLLFGIVVFIYSA